MVGGSLGATDDGLSDVIGLNGKNVGIAVESVTDEAQGVSAIVLTSLGLAVIVEVIDVAKKIFHRFENYVIHRTTCTLQLLVLFSLATMCVDTKECQGCFGDDKHTIPMWFAWTGSRHDPDRWNHHFHCTRLRGVGQGS